MNIDFKVDDENKLVIVNVLDLRTFQRTEKLIELIERYLLRRKIPADYEVVINASNPEFRKSVEKAERRYS